jgi:23S rRNA (cytidine1920-2'-O)/16S rRNA (cytidine1409-2'-O)-methyltransferase
LKGARLNRARLDQTLAERGLVPSREKAQALILAGRVRVGGEIVRRAGRLLKPDEELEVLSGLEYASRGGEKLAPALDALAVSVAGRVCADVGASTGGFTDVLLRRGAARVYAIDVGRGLIHWRLRDDPRVVLMERVNARHLDAFPETVSLVTVDVSFIGLEKVLPAVRRSAPKAEVVVLFKPQFQVGREQVGSKGVVRDSRAIAAALDRFRTWCASNGYRVAGDAPSALPGAEGNREVFLRLVPQTS